MPGSSLLSRRPGKSESGSHEADHPVFLYYFLYICPD